MTQMNSRLVRIPAQVMQDQDETSASPGLIKIPSQVTGIQIPESLQPSDYTKQKPLRETGELIGKIAARSYEQSIQSVMGDNMLSDLVVRGALAFTRGVTSMEATVRGEVLGDDSRAAMTRGVVGALRPEEQPNFLVGDVESAVESLPVMGTTLAGAALGALVGVPPQIGMAIGGAAGGYAAAESRARYGAELQIDQIAAEYKAAGLEMPMAQIDDAIDKTARMQAVIEAGIEGVSGAVTGGIGSLLVKRRIASEVGKQVSRKYIKSLAVGRAAKVTGAFAAGAAVEGLEEVATEIGQSFFDVDPRERGEFTFGELARAFRGGVIGGTVIGGGQVAAGAAAGKVVQSRREKQMTELQGRISAALTGDMKRIAKYEDQFEDLSDAEIEARIQIQRDAMERLEQKRDELRGPEESRTRDEFDNAEELASLARQIELREDDILAREQAQRNLRDGVAVRRVEVSSPDQALKNSGLGTIAEDSDSEAQGAAVRLRELGFEVVVVQPADAETTTQAFFLESTPDTIYLNDVSIEGVSPFAEGIHEGVHVVDHLVPELAMEMREILSATVRRQYAEDYTSKGDTRRDMAARARLGLRSPGQVEGATSAEKRRLRQGETFAELEGTATAIGMGAELLEGDKGRISAAIDKVAARLGFLGQEAKAAQRFIESLKSMNEQRQVRSRLKPGATVTLRGVGAELDNTALESRRGENTRANQSRLNRAEADSDLLESRRRNPAIQQLAATYSQNRGLAYNPDEEAVYAEVDLDRAKAIADEFNALPEMNLDDPETREAYRAMADETVEQYEFLEQSGVKFVPWAGVGEPYINSQEMIEDVENNNRLFYFKTINPQDPETFGEDVAQYIEDGHPLFEEYGDPVPDSNGDMHQQNVNDLFRAVHDYFGHAKEGFQFGPRGEENAWRVHSQMYSPMARRAMTTETRGQNSWVNFGPHMRREDGTLPVAGEPDFVPLSKRRFADQKVALLPKQYAMLDEEVEAGATALESRRANTKEQVDAVLDAVKAKTARDLLAGSDMVKWMDPEDARAFTRSDVAQKAIDKYEEFVSDRKLLADALKILPAASEWYILSEQVFAALGEGKIPLWKLVAVIATTSAQKSVKSNVDVGLKTANAYLQFVESGGDPSNTEALLQAIAGPKTGKDRKKSKSDPTGKMKRILSEGTGPLYLYADVLGTADVLQSETMDEVIERLLSPGSMIKEQLDLDKGAGAARKLASFLRNLMGDDGRVTNDVWMAFWWGVDQQNFSSGSGYAAATAAMRNVAASVGMSPAQGQAAAWALARVYLGRIRNEKKRSSENRRKFADVIAEPVTIEDLLGTDIGSLLVSPTLITGGKEVANAAPDLLRSLGFDPDAARDIVGDFEQRYREAYRGVDFSLPGSLGPRRAARLVRRFEQADIERNIKKNIDRAKEGKDPLPVTQLASRRGEFSSVLERTLGDLDRSKITTPEKLRSALGQAGVEREEIYWSGIDEWMKTQDPKGPIDIDEALATIQPTEVFTTIQSAKAMAESRLALKTEESDQTTVMRGDPKWSDYLPGGSGSQTNLIIQYQGREGKTPQVTDQGVVLDEKKQGASHRFFDGDDNMLVHIRATDQTWEDEGDTFHLAEVQSDWAKRIRSEQDLKSGKMPVAPFVFSKRKGKVSPAWQKLALKRALAFAVDEGYKYISIPNSELVNSVDGISVRGKGYDALAGMMTNLLKDYGYDPNDVSPQFAAEVPAEDLGFTGEGQTEEQRRETFIEENLDSYLRDQIDDQLREIGYTDFDQLVGPLDPISAEDIARAHNTPGFQGVEAALQRALKDYYSTWEALTQWNSDTWSPDGLPDGFPQLNHDVVKSYSGQLGLDGSEITVFQIRSKKGEVLGEASSFREAHELLANIQIEAILQFGEENGMEIQVADPDLGWLTEWGESLVVFDGDTDTLEDGFREWLGDSDDFREYVSEMLDEVFYDYDAQEMGESAPLDEDAAANVYELGDASEEGTIAYNVKQQLDTVGMPLFSRRDGGKPKKKKTKSFRKMAEEEAFSETMGEPGNPARRKAFQTGFQYGREEQQLIREEKEEAARERAELRLMMAADRAEKKLARTVAKLGKQLETQKRLADRKLSKAAREADRGKVRAKIENAIRKTESEFRENGRRLVNLLPRVERGRLLNKLDRVKDAESLMDFGQEVSRIAHYTRYMDARNRLTKVERVSRRRMTQEVKGQMREKLAEAEAVIKPGSYLTPQTESPVLKEAFTRANELLDQAMALYTDLRADFRQAKDERAQRLEMDADQIVASVPAKVIKKQRSTDKRREGVIKKTLRLGGDLEALTKAIDPSGTLHQYLYGNLVNAESKYFNARREIQEKMESAAVEAGFNNLQDLRAKLSDDDFGRGSTETRVVIIDGEKQTITLGAFLKLLALDEETQELIMGDVDQDKVGVGLAFSEEQSDVIRMTPEEYDAIKSQASPSELKLVESLKEYRESLRDPAFDVVYQLTGNQPRFVEGYEPRSRAKTASREPDMTQSSAVAASFMENGGFTKERIEGGGSAVLIGDFLRDFANSTDMLVRLANMGIEVRDANAILRDQAVEEAIVKAFGQDAHQRLVNMFQVGAGVEPRVVGGSPAGAFASELTGAYSQGVLMLNPGTYSRVLLGGIARMISDVDISLPGLVRAVTNITDLPSFEQIQELSGYFYSRGNEQAIDRRSNQQQTQLEDVRKSAAVKHLKSVFTELSGGRVNNARRELQRAFGQVGLLDYLDKFIARIAVKAHMNSGKDFDQAVRAAEMTIRRTQNTTSPMDDPYALNSKGARYILPFASDPLKAGSRLYEAVATGNNNGLARWMVSSVMNAGVNVATRPLMGLIGLAVAEFLGDDEDQLINEAQLYLNSPFSERGGQAAGITIDVAEEVAGSAGAGSFLLTPIASFIARKAIGEKAYSSDIVPAPLAYQGVTDIVTSIERLINSSSEETREKYMVRLGNLVSLLAVGDTTGPLRRTIFGANSYFGKYDPKRLAYIKRDLKALVKDNPDSPDAATVQDFIDRIDIVLAEKKAAANSDE